MQTVANDDPREPDDTITLRRMTGLVDLCGALEAAQFARVFVYPSPSSMDHQNAIAAFIDIFGAATDSWDEADVPNKAPVLDLLCQRLAVLESLGLFLHCGTAIRALLTDDTHRVVLPLAVISIDDDASACCLMQLPEEALVTDECRRGKRTG